MLLLASLLKIVGVTSVSYRRDASSRFAPENRWGDFWAASVAWMITREDFMKDITWINMLKLKASFGQQGNDDILFPGGYTVGVMETELLSMDGPV